MLKKIAILTAAAGMLSTSMAVLAEGPTVYGRVAFGFQSISGETDAVDSQKIEDKLGSRLGVKGTNDLGNGTSVDYLLEYGAGESLGLRHANMSLNGSFGQFRLGKQTGVLYRYIGANSDQSTGAKYAGKEWYTIAGKDSMNSDHSLRMTNIAAYRFGAGPGGDDPITFDIQIQGEDMSKAGTAAGTEFYRGTDDYGNPLPKETKARTAIAEDDATDDEPARTAITEGQATERTAAYSEIRERTTDAVAAKDDDKTIDSVTIGAATSLGPVKFQLAYVDENGSEATGDKSPSLLSLGFRVPLGSAEIRGHMTEVDPDMKDRDDNEAWGLLLMNDFGGGYFGMIGVGNYTDGGRGKMGTAAVVGGLYARTATTVDGSVVTPTTGDMIRLEKTVTPSTADRTTAPTTTYRNYDTDVTVPVGDPDDGGFTLEDGGVDETKIEERQYKAATKGEHKDAGDLTTLYASLTKSFGGGLSVVAEYSTFTKTITETKTDGSVDDDDETTNEFHLSLIQTF